MFKNLFGGGKKDKKKSKVKVEEAIQNLDMKDIYYENDNGDGVRKSRQWNIPITTLPEEVYTFETPVEIRLAKKDYNKPQ